MHGLRKLCLGLPSRPSSLRLSRTLLATRTSTASFHMPHSPTQPTSYRTFSTTPRSRVPRPYRFDDSIPPPYPPKKENDFGIGTELRGESGQKYVITCPVCVSRIDDDCHIWTATVLSNPQSREVIVKVPNRGLELFKKEMKILEIFKNSTYVRRKLDCVPPTDQCSVPLFVLDPFERTLWEAHMDRPLHIDQIKWIMKKVLLGLWEVHLKGLVYGDLSINKILVNGIGKVSGPVYNIDIALNGSQTISAPGHAIIPNSASRASYHSPELLFNYPVSFATDIWSWGMVLCHLLESQHDLRRGGLYDDACDQNGNSAAGVRYYLTRDFELPTEPFYEHAGLPIEPNKWYKRLHIPWQQRLRTKGLKEEDILFLSEVLDPNPETRPSIEEILLSGYLDRKSSTCLQNSLEQDWISLPQLREVSERQRWVQTPSWYDPY